MPTPRLTHVLSAVQSQVWAIEPGFGRRMLAILDRKLAGQEISAEERARIAAEGGTRQAIQTGAVMVLPVFGVITHRADLFVEMCGGTSIARLMRDFDAAVANPDITAIVLEFDSGGGSVAMVPEFAAKILAATKIKDVIAVINTDCHSAAYWLASACTEVVITESGQTGSVGCFILHLSTEEADKQEGYEWTLIKAGDYKAEGLEQFKLEEDAKNYLQTRVDEYYDKFVAGVAKGREVSVKTVRDNFGQGRSMGAQAAVDNGLADRIGTFESVLTKLTGKSRKSPVRAAESALVVAAGMSPAAVAGREAVVELDPKVVEQARALHAEAQAPYVVPNTEPAARGGAGGSAVPSPAPAPKAKEKTMEDDLETGAAPGGAGAAVAAAPGKDAGALALAAERLRTKGLNTLGKQHKVDPEQVSGWIDNGVSVQAAKDEILAAHAQASSTGAPRAVAGEPNEGKKPFASFGEQMLAITKAGKGEGVDPRLHHLNRVSAAASGMNEGVGSDGGFAVQKTFLSELVEPAFAASGILSRMTRLPVQQGTNGVKMLVIDETDRATGSRFGGIQMYWAAEADTATAKKPKLRLLEMDLKKLIGIAYMTEEVISDAGFLQAILQKGFQSELQFMLEDAFLNGTGAGQPLGLLTSDAVVQVAIEGGQTIANSNQSIAINLAKMLSNIPPSLWADVVALYNPELLSTFIAATIGANGAVPVWLPANGIAGKPFDTLLGRVSIPTEYNAAVGTPGDLTLTALSQYVTCDKDGVKESTSMHVRFLFDEMAYKITYRTDGQPIWKQKVKKYKGGNVYWAPTTTLAVRV